VYGWAAMTTQSFRNIGHETKCMFAKIPITTCLPALPTYLHRYTRTHAQSLTHSLPSPNIPLFSNSPASSVPPLTLQSPPRCDVRQWDLQDRRASVAPRRSKRDLPLANNRHHSTIPHKRTVSRTNSFAENGLPQVKQHPR